MGWPRKCAARPAFARERQPARLPFRALLFPIHTIAIAAAIGACLIASPAGAYRAEIAWAPVEGAAGYELAIGYDALSTAASRDIGSVAPGADGVVRFVVTDVLHGPTAYFLVRAYDADGRLSDDSNALALPWSEVAFRIDSDADGLVDGAEDTNLNGVRDPGETDARDADTDGDGYDDGEETRAGTDPLDAGSLPGCAGACAVWVAARDAQAWLGSAREDERYAGGADADPLADALMPSQLFFDSTSNAMWGGSGDEAHYDVVLPASGSWYVWGRFYYPGSPGSNDANSFFLRVDGVRRKLGNNKGFFRVWHWDGDGSVEHGAPVALPLGELSAGTHRIVIEKREVLPAAPRLDALVFTRDPHVVPDDLAARDALAPAADASTTTTVWRATTTTIATTTTLAAPTTTLRPTTTTLAATTTTLALPPATLPVGCATDTDCDDAIFCTLDRCEAGACRHLPFDAFCDDDDVCNGVERCDPIRDCVAGTPLTCDNGIACDGAEGCDPARGCTAGRPVVCDDGVACTRDRCVEPTGACEHVADAQTCADANPCTTDRCTTSGCVSTAADGAPCDDGLSCTGGDTCLAGRCVGTSTCANGLTCSAESGACEAVPGDPDEDGLSGSNDPCPLDARNRCFGPVAFERDGARELRLHAYPKDDACGGERVDCDGNVWHRDFGYEDDGKALRCELAADYRRCRIDGAEAIFGCATDSVEDILRCAHQHRKRLRYRFRVEPGGYLVQLFFVAIDEDTEEAGDSEVDVTINEHPVVRRFDIVRAAGVGRVAVRAFPVEVGEGGELLIELRPREGRVTLAALEVLARANR